MKKRRKKSNLFISFGKWIGKAIVWIVTNIAKAIYYTFKGIYLGIKLSIKKIKESTNKEIKKNKQNEKQQKSLLQSDAFYLEPECVKTNSGDIKNFQKRLQKESLIIAIAGRRGSGKSALGFKFLENISAKSKRPCFVLGVKKSVLPKWITSIDSLEDVQNNGVVLVDEGAISFGSRSSMSKQNKQLQEILAIARHKDLTLFFITQNTGMIDKTVLNLCDTLIFKEGSLLQEKMERNVMKDMYKTANKELKTIPLEDRKAHCYIIDSDFEGILKVALPSFWSSKISKSNA